MPEGFLHLEHSVPVDSVNGTDGLHSARVMGCYCDEPPRLSYEAGSSSLLRSSWEDIGATEKHLIPSIRRASPSEAHTPSAELKAEVLNSASEAVEAGELRIKGADGRASSSTPGCRRVPCGGTAGVAVVVRGDAARSGRAPKGTNW